MSGHSKWANIKYKKAAQDAKKGRVFTKIAREITVAVKHGGEDPSANPRLRLALDKAKSVNMPKDNVERAIKKGTGAGNEDNYEDVMYEGYGPGGVALLVSVLTDNRNRTVADIRRILTRHGGSLGESGCVGWIFERRGVITVCNKNLSEEKLFNLAIEAGALDINVQDESYEVLVEPQDIEKFKGLFAENGITVESAEVIMKPKSTIPVEKEDAKKLLNLLNELDEHDDVQDVYSNFEIDDSILEELKV
jgi:YebC/PmpR family DNA-binding regulatory protein